MRMWPWLSRVRTAERVGEGSSPRTSSSPVSNKSEGLGCVDAERFEHFGREHFAHAALQGQASVGSAAVRGLARTLGSEVEQAVPLVAKLGEGEAAAVADVRIVHAELMAVISKRERLRQIVRQRLEPAEMPRPLLRQPAPGRPAPPSGG